MRVRSYDESGAMFAIAVNYSTKVTDFVFDNKWHDVSYVVSGASTSSTTYLKITASMALNGLLIDNLKVEQSADFYPAPVLSNQLKPMALRLPLSGTTFLAQLATTSTYIPRTQMAHLFMRSKTSLCLAHSLLLIR